MFSLRANDCSDSLRTDVRLGCEYAVYDELTFLIRNIYNRIHPSNKTALDLWQLNITNWSLICPNSKAVELTKSEFLLIKILFEHVGHTVSKSDIVQQLGCAIESYDFRRLETLVRRLRNKIMHDTELMLPLKTIHAIGYAFIADISIV